MVIQHDIISQMTSRQTGINSTNYAKSSEKLSSGYRINKAADDSAGLVISEEMRHRIRGLKQGAKNAEDGIAFIGTGDGAMAEIEDMIHRMRELTIQSLNDTNTSAERVALEKEFEALRSEIDSISNDTQFNTQNVFDEHAPSYYQINGNVRWTYDQHHEVNIPDNDLVIKLGSKTYTVTVPAGSYTSLELIDEIDTALLGLKPNPGLSLDYSDGGYCNLTLEGGTNISSVSGALSYLIYGCYNGGTYGSLLGTTAFERDYPLAITPENNTLTFYMQSMTGGGDREVTLTLKEGNYGKKELIDLINKTLTDNGVPDIRAKEYGESSIQMSGIDYIVTGLKGNMFKLETSGNIYTSVFYDNVKYGGVSGDKATVTGCAYYNSRYTTGFVIEAGINDTLRVKLNGAAGYTTIKIAPSTSSGYTCTELKDAVNQAIKDAGLENEFVCNMENKYFSPYGYSYSNYNYLVLETKQPGDGKSIEIDTADPVSDAAYKTLFTTTNFSYTDTAYKYTSYNYLHGSKRLSAPVNIGADKTLWFSVGGTDYSVTLSESSYANASGLAKDIQTNLPAYLKDKLTVTASGSSLRIEETVPTSLGPIEAPGGAGKSGLFYELFVGDQCKYVYETDTGTIHYNQGSTAPDIVDQASITMPYPIPSDSITVTASNNRFSFQLLEPGSNSYVSRSIKLTERTTPYTKKELIAEINKQLKAAGYPAEASIAPSGAFRLTTTYPPSGSTQSFGIRIYRSETILRDLVGIEPDPYESSRNLASIQGRNPIKSNYTIDANNDTLAFKYDGKDVTIKIPQKTYSDGNDLANAVQNALDAYTDVSGNKILDGKLDVTNNSTGLCITTTEPGDKFNSFSCSGNFYENVLCKQIRDPKEGTPDFSDGTFKWEDAFVIGRQDLQSTDTTITKNLNDEFVIDFNCPDGAGGMKALPLSVTIPPGDYDGDSLATVLKTLLNDQLHAKYPNLADFSIDAAIGGHSTSVVGNNDASALQFTLHYNTTADLPGGEYYLDGVRGNSAFVLFYKNTGLPQEAYVNGSANIGSGVTIQPGKDTFHFTVDGVTYNYKIPQGTYTSNELIDKLNELFQKPDTSGNIAPVIAELDHGSLKLKHNSYGRHPITDIGGSAKGTIFYKEEGRLDQDKRMLQLSDGIKDSTELTRVQLNTRALRINYCSILRTKYAKRALPRLDYALDYLNSKRSIWGALNNRLEKAVSINLLSAENTQGAESRIRDADYADELLKNSSSRILMQAGQAVLAQNASSLKNVLQLLQ